MSAELEKGKADRFRFLKLLYEKTDGDEYKWLNMRDIGAELGLNEEETSRVTQYLAGERLLVHRALGGTIGITHRGVVEMEKALSDPEKPTQYFPPAVNIIHVEGDMIGSQVQQATTGSQQTRIDNAFREQLSKFLDTLNNELGQIKLEASERKDLEGDIETVRAQMKRTEPKQSILREALGSIRRILEAGGASVLAAEAAKLLSAVL